jgi:hypothetical protein
MRVERGSRETSAPALMALQVTLTALHTSQTTSLSQYHAFSRTPPEHAAEPPAS